jgi:hypothetical protein
LEDPREDGKGNYIARDTVTGEWVSVMPQHADLLAMAARNAAQQAPPAPPPGP